jgi:protein gp37
VSTGTGIEWTDATWNPVTGCTRVSAGCDHCYAVGVTRRLAAMGQGKYVGLVGEGKGHFNGVVRCHEDVLEAPLKWRKPRTVFVNSMSDLFHKRVPFEFVDRVFAVMALTPQHTYQILTKRPERMREYLEGLTVDNGPNPDRWDAARRPFYEAATGRERERIGVMGAYPRWPLPNVWLGTSVEDQAAADARIPHLLECPAAVRFLSCEPLLGAVDLDPCWLDCDLPCTACEEPACEHGRIDWVIVGGESGPGARPMHPDWVRGIRDQCVGARVAFFFKQHGDWMSTRDAHAAGVIGSDVGFPWGRMQPQMCRVGKKKAGRLLDGREWNEMPGMAGGEGE